MRVDRIHALGPKALAQCETRLLHVWHVGTHDIMIIRHRFASHAVLSKRESEKAMITQLTAASDVMYHSPVTSTP